MEFRVKALDREQAVLSQLIDAIDELDARRQLGVLGLRVIALAPVRQARLFARATKIPLVIFSQELVAYIDAHYRTLAQASSRGLAGHSMGGYGTIRIGMKHPEVFSSLSK